MIVVEASSIFQWLLLSCVIGVQMIISQYANEFKSYSLFQCRNLAFLARLRVRGDRSHQNFGAIKLVAIIRKTPSNVQTVATLKCQTGNPWYADNLWYVVGAKINLSHWPDRPDAISPVYKTIFFGTVPVWIWPRCLKFLAQHPPFLSCKWKNSWHECPKIDEWRDHVDR